jgi:hypothetical protein
MSDVSLTTTSFQIDYRMLTLLQKRANELGFRSWGAYLRHMIDFHVLTFEPDLLPRQSPANPAPPPSSPSAPSDAPATPSRSITGHPHPASRSPTSTHPPGGS